MYLYVITTGDLSENIKAKPQEEFKLKTLKAPTPTLLKSMKINAIQNKKRIKFVLAEVEIQTLNLAL